VDCSRCGKRKHSFFRDPVGEMMAYLTEPRRWCKKIVAIAHNAKSFDLHFILQRAVAM
jgi:DNA polymerase III alpha subunit (gram-positive type)